MGEPAVGLGVDVHAFSAEGELRLGGLAFPEEPALFGHSDGDVVCHAVADALLGAAALGDVGEMIPDTDPATGGISGADVVARVLRTLGGAGRAPVSVDVTLLCDRPAIAPRRDEMRRRLSELTGIPLDRVSVKATRPEGLGLAGDGIGCFAIAMVS